jgi:hypothetical protein
MPHIIGDDMNRVELSDGTVWPNPASPRFKDVAWTLRYGSPSKEEMLFAASVMDAYSNLILHPAFTLKDVQAKVSEIRKLVV